MSLQTFYSKAIATLLLSLYALVTILCLHFPARVLGGAGRFREVARLALNYYAYVIFSHPSCRFCRYAVDQFLRSYGISVFIGWGVLVLARYGSINSRLLRYFF